MLYSAKAVANGFIDIARSNREPITAMKLQKLVYCAHGWHLAIKNEPLIREMVEAWEWGPVIPALYQAFKEFGSKPITKKAQSFQVEGNEKDAQYHFYTPEISHSSGDHTFAQALLHRIWEVYGGYSAAQVSRLTHEGGTPWDEIRKKYPGRRGVDIPDKLIKVHFESKVKAA